MEVIESISYKEEIVGDNEKLWVGYEVKTSQQTVALFIEDTQRCCENFGCEVLSDRPDVDGKDKICEVFVGARVESVGWTSRCFMDTTITFPEDCYIDRTKNPAAVNITTSAGILQLVVWNEHNGYYPHDILARWKDYEDEQTL